jgi:hypothetical protein
MLDIFLSILVVAPTFMESTPVATPTAVVSTATGVVTPLPLLYPLGSQQANGK